MEINEEEKRKKINLVLKEQNVFIVICWIIILLALMVNSHPIPIADETWFWGEVQNYAQGTSSLIENALPQTPFFLFIFGTLHAVFKLNLVNLRFVNLYLFSFLLIMLYYTYFYSSQEKSNERIVIFWKFLILCAVTPYLFILATTLYTDMLFILLVMIAMMYYSHRWYFVSSCYFFLALSTRQFAIAFPFALSLLEFKQKNIRAGIWYLITTLSIGIYFFLFQGSLSPIGSGAQHFHFSLFSGFVFLAVLGAFYKIPEMLLFPPKENHQILVVKIIGFLMLACVFITLLFSMVTYPPQLLTGHHWFYFLYQSPLMQFAIGILASLSLFFVRRKEELMITLVSFAMFCWVSPFFDKYVVIYVLVYGYFTLHEHLHPPFKHIPFQNSQLKNKNN